MCISNVNMQSIDFKCFCIKPQMKDMFVFHEESYYTFSKNNAVPYFIVLYNAGHS